MERKPEERKPAEAQDLRPEEMGEIIERLDDIELGYVTCHHPAVYDAETGE
jgi:hypothetical protein